MWQVMVMAMVMAMAKVMAMAMVMVMVMAMVTASPERKETSGKVEYTQIRRAREPARRSLERPKTSATLQIPQPTNVSRHVQQTDGSSSPVVYLYYSAA